MGQNKQQKLYVAIKMNVVYKLIGITIQATKATQLISQKLYINADQMNKRLKIKIEKYNQVKYNSNRIIIKTLKPNCDKSLK